MHIACIKHAIHIHKISAAERLQAMVATCRSPNHFKTTTTTFIKTQPQNKQNKLHHLFGAFIPTYFPPVSPLLPVSCKASNSFCRCSNRCWCAVSLDAQVAFSSASMARSWNKTVQTLEAYWSPQVGGGWTTSNNHLHPFTMNHQPQSINHNNNHNHNVLKTPFSALPLLMIRLHPSRNVAYPRFPPLTHRCASSSWTTALWKSDWNEETNKQIWLIGGKRIPPNESQWNHVPYVPSYLEFFNVVL